MNDQQIELSRADSTLGIATVGISTANSFSHRGLILTEMGRFDEAAAAFHRFDEMAGRFNERELISWNDAFRSRLLVAMGDVQGALTATRRAIQVAERIGSLLARAIAHGWLGAALTEAGEWEAAQGSLEHALELSLSNRVGLFDQCHYRSFLAEACLGAGDAARARGLVEEAIALALHTQQPLAEASAHLARIRVLLTTDGVAARGEVEASLARASALVESTGARSLEAPIHVERARLAGVLGDAAGRLQWLRAAHRVFTELGARGHAARLAKELA